MIVGLDISTRCIGWCSLKEDGSFIDIGNLDLSQIKSMYEKAFRFKDFVEELYENHDMNKVTFYVEAPLKAFHANQSMAHTIIQLQKMNVLCCNWIYCTFDQEPTLIMESSARKKAGIKVPKGVKGKDKKKFVLDYVQSLGVVPDDKWALKRTGNPKDYCFDQADAFVIAKAGVVINENL